MSNDTLEKVWQEFYCGECVGYVRIKINMQLNCEIFFECPNCGHKHQRVIRNGVILEKGRFKDDPVFDLTPTKAAYSKKPWTAAMKAGEESGHWSDRRNGAVITKGSGRDAFTSQHFRDRWFERFGGVQNE